MEMFSTNFGGLDWGIVVCYLAAAVLVGIVANRFIHTVDGFLVGGRGMGTALNTATYITTGLGLVSLMYISIDGFNKGFAFLTMALMTVGMVVFIGLTGFVVKRLRSLKLMTVPEFFTHRYGKRTRVLAATIAALAGILNMGLFPKMGAMFITYATGLGAMGEDQTTLVNIVTSVLIVIVLFYTVLGGMVSVIITDFAQFIVLSIGMSLGLYFCLVHPDFGWERMTNTLAEQHGEKAFNPVAPGGYGWAWVVFNLLLAIAGCVSWGPELTRALTARSERVAVRTYLFAAPGKLVCYCIPVLWGIAAFCMVVNSPELCDAFFPEGLAGEAKDVGRAMPLVLGKIVPSGLLGLLVAGLLAAFMSTHDSYFLCWSSIIARDIALPLSGGRLTERQQIRITRISIICIGVFLLAWGVWYELPQSVWDYMSVTGTIYIAGAGIAIIGGVYWRRASSAGAVAALLGGLSAVPGVFLKPINRYFEWDVTVHQVGIATFVMCTALFIAFSLWMPDRPSTAVAEEQHS